jgi:hypothetical protein
LLLLLARRRRALLAASSLAVLHCGPVVEPDVQKSLSSLQSGVSPGLAQSDEPPALSAGIAPIVVAADRPQLVPGQGAGAPAEQSLGSAAQPSAEQAVECVER